MIKISSKKVVLITTVVLTLLFSVFAMLRMVNADASKNTAPSYKYFTSYEVKPGDTLNDIAEKYTANTDVSKGEYIDEVIKNNNLTNDEITSGEYIVIAYYSEELK